MKPLLLQRRTERRDRVPGRAGPGRVECPGGDRRSGLDRPARQDRAESRDAVAEIIRDSTFHHRGEPETFPCNSRVYLSLLNEPALTLALWKDLSPSLVQLRQIGLNRYEGTDGNGASATWDFVLRSPKLHVLLCNLQYNSPHGNAHLEARIVLVIHSGFYREVNGDPWVQHDVEAFVKVDSKGWKLVAQDLPPLARQDPPGPGPRGRLVRLADGPARGHVPELGLPGDREAG